MKRITVGRGNDCDIVIIDETDNVSRHHLVITFNFFGKMKVSDTSSNGTSINGTRMLKGTSIPVTTKDQIRLGRSIILDWNRVKDPYRPIRIMAICSICVLIAAGIGLYAWGWYKDRTQPSDNGKTELISTEIKTDDKWNKDSTAKVAPTITSIDVKDKNVKDKNVKDKKRTPSKEAGRKKKEVNEVYKPKAKSAYPNEKGSNLDSIAVF